MMTIRVGIGIGCRFVIQLLCIYTTMKVFLGDVNSFMLLGFGVCLGYLKLRSIRLEMISDVNDFSNVSDAYLLKKMTKEKFERTFEILDTERGIYVKKRNPLAAILFSRVYFAAVKDGCQGEVRFNETYYDYL